MSAPFDLQSQLTSDFFNFFHLTPQGEAITVAGGGPLHGQTWHSFRPSGPAFHAAVEVDVLTGSDGVIGAASLGLDRSFIDDPRNGAFARDVAKSFLEWAIRNPSREIRALIANVADLSGSQAPVIMRGPAPPRPTPDVTNLYPVYLGHAPGRTIANGGITLAFTNFSGAFPPARIFDAESPAATAANGARWLRIDVGL
jgi:hypothetical protein